MYLRLIPQDLATTSIAVRVSSRISTTVAGFSGLSQLHRVVFIFIIAGGSWCQQRCCQTVYLPKAVAEQRGQQPISASIAGRSILRSARLSASQASTRLLSTSSVCALAAVILANWYESSDFSGGSSSRIRSAASVFHSNGKFIRRQRTCFHLPVWSLHLNSCSLNRNGWMFRFVPIITDFTRTAADNCLSAG